MGIDGAKKTQLRAIGDHGGKTLQQIPLATLLGGARWLRQMPLLAQQHRELRWPFKNDERVGAHDVPQDRGRVAIGRGGGDARRLALGAQGNLLHERGENVVLVAEMVVKRGSAEPGGARDVLHARG